MSCDGGHLGFPIGIKNRNLVKDIPMTFGPGELKTVNYLKKMFNSKFMNIYEKEIYSNLILNISHFIKKNICI